MPEFQKCPGRRGLELLLCLTTLFPVVSTKAADAGANGEANIRAAGTAVDTRIIAQLPGRTVTLEELDAAGGREIYDASQQLHEARVRSLYRLLSEELLEREAKAANTSVAQLLQKAVTTTRDTVGESDIDAFFKGRGGNNTAQDADTRKQAAMYLVAKRRADEKRAFVATLFEKYGVRISLVSPPPPPAEEIRGAGEPAIGKADAPVTIVVFSDYRCPYCQDSSRTLNRLVESRPDDVRVIYRHFPTHRDSKALAQAALCAADQGRFADYHDLLFGSMSAPSNDPEVLAKKLGLDLATFSSCLSTASHAARIDADLKEGQRLGIQGTPTLFVNGVRLRGAQSYERLSAQVQAVLRKNNPVSLTHAH